MRLPQLKKLLTKIIDTHAANKNIVCVVTDGKDPTFVGGCTRIQYGAPEKYVHLPFPTEQGAIATIPEDRVLITIRLNTLPSSNHPVVSGSETAITQNAVPPYHEATGLDLPIPNDTHKPRTEAPVPPPPPVTKGGKAAQLGGIPKRDRVPADVARGVKGYGRF